MKYFLFLFAFILLACNGSKPQHEESSNLYDEVMAVHDEVMPKMRDIRVLTKQLKKIDNYADNPQIMGAITQLSKADDAMMDWMAQFKIPKEGTQQDEKAYLTGQMKSVNNMRDQMMAALDNAQMIVDQNK